MTETETILASSAMRVAQPRSPGLIQIAWQVRTRGALQFFMDQWRAQGDLPHLRMGRQKLVFIIHPDHVRHVLVTGRQGFDKLQTWESSRQLLLGDEEGRHPFAYYPFGGGQRVCIGNSFANLEAHILTALLARRFNPQLVAGHRPQIEMGGTLMIRNGLPMQITLRT